MTIHPNDDVAHNIINERRGEAIDRNPRIDCGDCGETFAWKAYWSDRVTAPDDEFVCDDCTAVRERRRRRRERNRELGEFA